MKAVAYMLAAISAIGLISGIALLFLGEVLITGIVWAATALISFSTYGIVKSGMTK